MDAIRASSGLANATAEYDRMVKIEFEAAEALAGLAHFPTNLSESRESERLKDESKELRSSLDTFPKCSSNSYEDATSIMLKRSGILTANAVKDERTTELGLNPIYPTNCASSGRKSRQNLTEAEMEARKIRRVLANRESARQTIRRRQAIFEELTRKAIDLSWENENLKREKESATKHYDSLKTKNKCLKAQMIRVMNTEAKEAQEESKNPNTNPPFIIYNQPPFFPFVWPPMFHPSRIQISKSNEPDSLSCEEGGSNSMMRSPLYLLQYPCVVALPQNNNEHRPCSINLNDKPKESPEYQQFFPEPETQSNGGMNNKFFVFAPDGGGGEISDSTSRTVSVAASPVSCKPVNEHFKAATTAEVGDGEKSPVVCPGKRLGEMAAAAEARKRRKQLTRLKNDSQCRELRMR